MLDVKELLKMTGLEVAETSFLKAPSLPFIIFLQDVEEAGADIKNNIIERNVTVEFYSARINNEKEKVIEDLLREKLIKFKKDRVYVDSQSFFETTYTFSLYEKEV
ncbi:MAG: hypothetical protein KH415_18555 [Clostridium sp.]|uniref:hypothetical protein n=1 Tax=Clostridium sp. TaxID=1506 RepID=UPI002900AA49|nr:hypothetical protein [Clostridium sp.]MBS6503583.1 hypothetical protein [Clostridium sp.]MDU2680055.1 hypothetical protein [Clostridium sp.]